MALATILGIPLEVNDYTQTIKGVGAFGFSLEIGRQSPPHQKSSYPSRRTGPSRCSLAALATTPSWQRALLLVVSPFSENEFWINGIYVNEKVLDAIKSGRAIGGDPGYGGRINAIPLATPRRQDTLDILPTPSPLGPRRF